MSTKVSESTGYVPNLQMSAFGYVMAAVLVIIMLPLLPVIAVAWVIWRVFFTEEQLESSYQNWRDDPNRLRPVLPVEAEEADEEAEAAA
ncbi:hypothetical protein D8Y22_09000 [Salinadaptatus halalkaliphilus]|uniref:Uncharacterized protein n=1 Tax=Salinadaptatus halalkaliphilus TaxID=2419781 RepID=A0A4V3VLE2_9EURY|nr:hypothetical protein [Salinadaptatus halalkaliphilus]THE65317.1 hypothetical protein D8Y22_09000 [Salinadaptatus halalkaliphilus]